MEAASVTPGAPSRRRSEAVREFISQYGLIAILLILLVVSIQEGWPDLTAFAAAAAAGAAYPPIGSCVRARWSYVLVGEATEIQTAYALESVIDEAIFIIGPTVATVLATTWHAWAGLGLALVTGVGGSFYLATQRDTQPDPQPRDQETGARPPMPGCCSPAGPSAACSPGS